MKGSSAAPPPWPGRRKMSIENVLRWAFATELPNAFEAPDGDALPSQHPMWKLRVDGGRGDWDAAAVARIVDSDAMAIGAAAPNRRQPLRRRPA